MSAEQYASNTALVKKYEDRIWEGHGAGDPVNGIVPPDEIQARVNAAVKRIEETCRSVLHAQHTLFGILNATLKSKASQ